MKSKIAESYMDSKVEEVDDVIKFGAPKLVVRLHNAIRAVELAEQETEERMRAKAHKIVKEMMGGMGINSIEALRGNRLMLRGIGLSMYLACLGLDAGAHFFDTVMRPEGAMWIGLGFALTLLPVLVMGWIALRWSRLDFGSTCGMLCGAMANPMALGYANDTIEGDNPSVSYATVYPLSMFLRVLAAQLLILIFG